MREPPFSSGSQPHAPSTGVEVSRQRALDGGAVGRRGDRTGSRSAPRPRRSGRRRCSPGRGPAVCGSTVAERALQRHRVAVLAGRGARPRVRLRVAAAAARRSSGCDRPTACPRRPHPARRAERPRRSCRSRPAPRSEQSGSPRSRQDPGRRRARRPASAAPSASRSGLRRPGGDGDGDGDQRADHHDGEDQTDPPHEHSPRWLRSRHAEATGQATRPLQSCSRQAPVRAPDSTPKRVRTPSRTSPARARMSCAVPPPRLLSASTCLVDRPTRPPGPGRPRRKPLCSMSHAAGSFTRSGPAGQRGRSGSSGTSATGRTGLVKNDPTLQVSWSAGSSTMPLPRRRSSTAIRAAPAATVAPGVDTEGAGQLGVADRGARAVRAQPEPDPQHHRVVAVLEHARAVAEPELGGRDVRAHLAGAPVVEVDVDEHVRNLDPVGAHVLHRGGAGAARDAGQALQPAEPHADRRRDEGVPVLTGLHGDEHGAVGQRFDGVSRCCAPAARCPARPRPRSRRSSRRRAGAAVRPRRPRRGRCRRPPRPSAPPASRSAGPPIRSVVCGASDRVRTGDGTAPKVASPPWRVRSTTGPPWRSWPRRSSRP